MADCDNDAHLQRFAADLRAAPVPLGDDARARVLAAVAARHPAPGTRDSAADVRARTGPLRWIVRRRAFALSPLAGAALAASLVGIGVLMGRDSVPSAADAAGPVATALSRSSAECTRPPAAGTGPSAGCRVPTQFVLVAPRASSVAVVGDFNDWRELPMRAAGAGGVWTVTVPLAPGRHTYSFVVDGTTWIADPAAPFAPEDGFGSRNSVVMVGESST